MIRQLIVILFLFNAISLNAEPLPAKLSAAVMLKLLSLEQSISDKKSLSFMVVNEPGILSFLKKYEGKKVGSTLIGQVFEGDLNTKIIPDVIYLGMLNKKEVDKWFDFIKQHKLLSFGQSSKLMTKGMVITIFNDEGVPGVLLNLNASKKLELKWNPKVLDVVKVNE